MKGELDRWHAKLGPCDVSIKRTWGPVRFVAEPTEKRQVAESCCGADSAPSHQPTGGTMPDQTNHGEAVAREIEQQRAQRSAPPSSERMLQFFRYEHLPEHLQAVSAPFGRLALQIAENLPSNPERTVALRKLLEAKDAAVRAVLFEG